MFISLEIIACLSCQYHKTSLGHAAAKGIFLGGVTRRFPELRFAFLEGGVGWASQLFGDLIEHWERRNAKALENMKPEKLDRKLLMELVEKYGYAEHAAALRERDGWPDPELHMTGNIDNLDDFAACKITRKEDWVDLYATPYYFGCEADDRMNAVAFGKGNPFGAQLNAIYSSDIGHFDVIDMRDPLPEAYELVEDGHITEANFRDFVFANAVRLWGTQNPRFFEGTVVEKEAAAVCGRRSSSRCTRPRRNNRSRRTVAGATGNGSRLSKSYSQGTISRETGLTTMRMPRPPCQRRPFCLRSAAVPAALSGRFLCNRVSLVTRAAPTPRLGCGRITKFVLSEFADG